MNDIANNYTTLYKRLLTITLLPLSQAANLVAACLKMLNAMVTSTLASNIPPSLTSDIWSSSVSNSDSYLSCTIHIVTKNFEFQSFYLGALPSCDNPHNQDSISEMWLCMCADMLGIDSDCMQPAITTDGASSSCRLLCQWLVLDVVYLQHLTLSNTSWMVSHSGGS